MVTEGKTNTVIILGSDAIPAELTAANELQSFIRQMSGAEIPIVESTGVQARQSRIFIGQTAVTKDLLPGFDWKSLIHDGILIKRVGTDLVIAGDRPRGTLYAVYEYLESLGAKFLSPDETIIPQKATIGFPKSDKQYVPQLYYRELTYFRVLRKNPEFCARLHVNGGYNPTPVEYGGNYSLIGFCHTFDFFLPASRYFAEHPEWYSEINGKRIGGQFIGQLCLTNKEMKKEFIRRVLEEIKRDPNAGLLSVSQNDGAGPCTCAQCTAAVKKLGNQTDLMVSFANDVAAAVEKEYPDFMVENLAYTYTRTPPKTVRPRKNVLIRLCTGGNFAKPFNSEDNKPMLSDLTNWSKIVDKMFIWDYTVGFANLQLPYPNTQVLAPNIRTFVANKVIGLHEQGDLYNTQIALQPMKAYMLAKLMWDPSLDAEKLEKDFLNGYYGAAGKYLYSYVKLLETSIGKCSFKLEWNSAMTPYFTPDAMVKAFDLFDKAEKSVAGNAKLLDRVKQQKLSLQQAWVRTPLNIRDSMRPKLNIDDLKLVDEYQKLAEATGNVYISEQVHISWDEFRYAAVGDTTPDTNPVPERVKNLPAANWKEIRLNRTVLAKSDVASFVDDPKAVSGKAIRISGSSYDWAAQITVSPFDLKNFTKAEVIVSVKCLGRGTEGKAFEIGVYDSPKSKFIPSFTYNLQSIKDDEYHEYSAGVVELTDGMTIYAAPPGNSKLIDAMYIDRVYLVKSDK